MDTPKDLRTAALNVLFAWLKWAADLSGTKTQAAYVGMGLAVYSVVSRLAEPVQVILICFGAWGVIKWQEVREARNGAPAAAK